MKTYTGDTLAVCGEMLCDVVYKGHEYALQIIVAHYEKNPPLLERNWLNHIRLEWGEVFRLTRSESESAKRQLNSLLAKHSELFKDCHSYEGMKGLEAHNTMKDGAKPIFIKPPRVSCALKKEVEKEWDKLENNRVIVEIVVVPKADKSVRICGDYKVTINSAVEDEQYPLPTQQDLCAALSGSKFFSKLDLSHAYA